MMTPTGVLGLGNCAQANATAHQQRMQAPAFYRFMLGAFEIMLLSDGTHPFPDAMVLTTPASTQSSARPLLFKSNAAEAKALLKAADATVPTEGSINAFLINTGKKLILIDSGASTLYGSCCGHLLNNLKAAGYRPEQIDEVLLTHLHEDQVGGLAPNGKMAFPNATVRASQADVDYWLNADHERVAPAFLHAQFDGARISLRPYKAVGHFKPFPGSGELSPGIRARPAAGHTPVTRLRGV
jgi:glyoxylase-like metal-dependent hydrolase (beta-lactamase superfamily II)